MTFGLLGRKLGHSYSPMIFRLLGGYEYRLYEREPEEIQTLLRDEEFDGLNVTIPYKKDVFAHLDEVDDLAMRLHSVNTIVKRNGHLTGHNSDYYGFSALLEHSGFRVSGEKVLVLGTGGASVTVCAVLEDLGAQVVIISRSGENHYGNLHLHSDAKYLVNATPVGMYPHTGQSPVDLTQFPQLKGVLDLIYNPARTQLLLQAEQLGIPGFNGLWMLVAQAKKSAEWFLDQPLADSTIPTIHAQLRDEMENIALIGMAGCGKTTIGSMLAQHLGRPFVDIDQRIVQRAGKSIPEIFAQDGEEAFRALETQILEEVGKASGQIIATGGGCVTQPRNYPLLHQNSRILWIQRDPSILPTAGRPLSQKTDPRILFQQRQPLYVSFADASIVSDGTKQACLGKVLSALKEM